MAYPFDLDTWIFLWFMLVLSLYSRLRLRKMRLQIVSNALSIRFRYLDFSMVYVGSISVFKVNLYNPLVHICMIILSFHAK
jgi:hypothetical protein